MPRSWIPCALLCLGCITTNGTPEDLAASIAAAHGEVSLYAKPTLHGRVEVEFGGQPMLAARLTYEAATGRVRLDHDSGGVAVFDGEEAWVLGLADEELPMARFHLLTWAYFLAAPWKLGDPGARMGPAREDELRGEAVHRARLTFGEGVGDTPDDWYVVYADSERHRLRALAYIVTYGTRVEEAEAEPHVATYESWSEVGGLELPRRLRFWNWSAAEGIVGQPIGEARFTDLRFAASDGDAFERPPGARRAPGP